MVRPSAHPTLNILPLLGIFQLLHKPIGLLLHNLQPLHNGVYGLAGRRQVHDDGEYQVLVVLFADEGLDYAAEVPAGHLVAVNELFADGGAADERVL
jgi:hypothetical protein